MVIQNLASLSNVNMNKQDCVFKEVCKECKLPCAKYSEMNYLMTTSNIPKDYIKPKKLYPEEIDLESFKTLDKIKHDIINFVNDGRFLYLWSKLCGNAKTSWSCKLLLTYFAVICSGNQFQDRGWFEYIPSFTLLTKEFNNDLREIHIQNITKRALVIFDDIGSITNSNYDLTILLSIIDSRKANGLATIFTSNLSIESLERSLGSRLADRCGSDIVIEFKGGSRRTYTNEYNIGGEND